MTGCQDFRVSPHLADLKAAFCGAFYPGAIITMDAYRTVLSKLSNAQAIAAEMEAEFDILANMPTPDVPTPARADNVVRLRPRPRLVIGGHDGGDAA